MVDVSQDPLDTAIETALRQYYGAEPDIALVCDVRASVLSALDAVGGVPEPSRDAEALADFVAAYDAWVESQTDEDLTALWNARLDLETVFVGLGDDT